TAIGLVAKIDAPTLVLTHVVEFRVTSVHLRVEGVAADERERCGLVAELGARGEARDEVELGIGSNEDVAVEDFGQRDRGDEVVAGRLSRQGWKDSVEPDLRQ